MKVSASVSGSTNAIHSKNKFIGNIIVEGEEGELFLKHAEKDVPIECLVELRLKSNESISHAEDFRPTISYVLLPSEVKEEPQFEVKEKPKVPFPSVESLDANEPELAGAEKVGSTKCQFKTS